MSKSALIVCLGNICRSPMGEAVLRHVAAERKLDVKVDSAGTAAYHVGEEPDERTVEICCKHGIPVDHLGRQVSQDDFHTFDYILAADENNLRNLERIKPRNAKAEVRLFGSFDDGKPIADPYYVGLQGFETTYKQCLRYSNAFLDEVFGKEVRTTSL